MSIWKQQTSFLSTAHCSVFFVAREIISSALAPISCLPTFLWHSQLVAAFFTGRHSTLTADEVLETKKQNTNNLRKKKNRTANQHGSTRAVLKIWLCFFPPHSLCASLSLPLNAAVISFYSAFGPRCLALWTVTLRESNSLGQQKQTDLRHSRSFARLLPRLLIEHRARQFSKRGWRRLRGAGRQADARQRQWFGHL